MAAANAAAETGQHLSRSSIAHRITFFAMRLSRSHHRSSNGMSLTEVVVAAGTSALLLGGSTVAMRSLNGAMQASSQLNDLRGSSLSGLRLLRAETQRSLHLMVQGGSADDDQQFSNLNHSSYSEALEHCQSISSSQQQEFNPLMGMRMAELDAPVVYGLGMSSDQSNYALVRCGAALDGDGRYDSDAVVLSRVLDNIGITPCTSGNCNTSNDLRSVVAQLDTSLQTNNTSHQRVYPEPALAIRTDSARKLLQLIDPTEPEDAISESFLQPQGQRRELRVGLSFLAYARADKISRSDADFLPTDNSGEDTEASGCAAEGTCSFYGIPVNSTKLHLIVDGSGSMSTCIAWGSTYSSQRRTFFNGSRYFSTRQTCLLTRMEALQNELRTLLDSLADHTLVSLQAFSSPGYLNHRSWLDGATVPLNETNRASALEFVNSLSDGTVTRWGRTEPWAALNLAMTAAEAHTVLFMTDGSPDVDPNGGSWSSADEQPTATTYINLANNRTPGLSVSTVSVGQDATWLELLSNGASGTYEVIN